MSSFKPVSLLTSQYLRKVGLTQAIPIAGGCCHRFVVSHKRPIYPDKVRLGFIPDNWFEFFYPRTGRTGPYVFGLGLLNLLFSKEIYVCDGEFYTGLSWLIICVVAVKKFGPRVANYCDREIEKFEIKWKKQCEEELKDLADLIECEQLEQWRAEGSLMLMQAKKDNIALQLEAAYREALMKVYKDVKCRLDYQLVCRYLEERIKRKHKVDWVVRNVMNQLPENLDVELLNIYKRNLNALAFSLK